jgi:hypothetical protein
MFKSFLIFLKLKMMLIHREEVGKRKKMWGSKLHV